VQPSCACSGRATARRRAKPRNAKADFFIGGLHFGEVIDIGEAWMQDSIAPYGNPVSVVPSGNVRKQTVIWYLRGIFIVWPSGIVFSVFARH
jgi:hypothetical protein